MDPSPATNALFARLWIERSIAAPLDAAALLRRVVSMEAQCGSARSPPMNPPPPVPLHPHYHYDASGWFFAGLVGWFLFIYLLQRRQCGAIGALFLTFICFIPACDIIAIVAGSLPDRRYPIEIYLFALLPYLLIGFGIYWLVKHPRSRKPPRGWREKLALRILVSIRRWRRRRKSSAAIL